MSSAFNWVELFLHNSKAVASVLFILISALGATSWTVVDQHEELTELEDKLVIEVHTPEPVKHEEYNHKQIIKDIKQLQNEVRRLREWH